MNKQKASMAVLSLAMIGAVAVGGTAAYLSDVSTTLKNSFTVGAGYHDEDCDPAVAIWEMDYKDGSPVKVGDKPVYTNIGNTKTDGTKTDGTKTGGTYDYGKFLPSDCVTKDPYVRINRLSPASWVFLKVTGMDEAAENDFVFSGFGNKWVKVKANSDGEMVEDDREGYDGLWGYLDIVPADNNTQSLFTKVTYSAGVTESLEKDTTLGNVELVACAVQAKNVPTLGDAFLARRFS